jgi:hypothetical protein
LPRPLDAAPVLWRHYGDLAALKADLRGPDPLPLGRLPADRMAVCWVELAFGDAVVTKALRWWSCRHGCH